MNAHSKPRLLKALIFDMDGLMVDSERLYLEVEREMARRFHKEFDTATWQKMMGLKPTEGIRVFVETLDLPLSPEDALVIRDVAMRKKYREEAEPMPGLFHILDAFDGRLKLAVGTGAQREFLEIVVDRLGIRDRFAVLQSSDEIERGKPDPGIYLACCRKLGLEPRDCAVLEDCENGALAGVRAGCYTIVVPTEHSRTQDFRCADYVAADLFDAERHISALLSAAAPGGTKV
jgi:HAD superfamily hydrolase (TIGR01509 family)